MKVLYYIYVGFVNIYALINGSELQSPNQLTTGDKTEIKTLTYFEEKDMLLAGYASGNLGIWEFQNNIFNFRCLEKLHDDVKLSLIQSINKMSIFQGVFLITCSNDRCFKIFNLQTFSLLISQQYVNVRSY